ncbi:MAG: UDP-N-acetylmuramoyl-L-alanine--D-glutamate ligase [Porphyromonas sp.]|nr:UDP-N-acetylmuramoyl-L-alanine--D-glutamate ligase [Porphyromonas sp.]
MKSTIIILGGGESGVSAALLAKEKGYTPFLSDAKELRPQVKATIEDAGILYEEGGHRLPVLEETVFVVKSPGIPDSAEVVQRCLSAGLPIISEIELAAKYLQPRQLIGITGSNGKTTTTTLIELGLKSAGISAAACGNIGNSLARKVMDGDADTFAVELSSFQLDHMYETHHHIALLLNITPDHLDRYDYQLANYARAKWRLFQNQGAGDYAIINADDPIIGELLQRYPLGAEHLLRFSCRDPQADAYFDGTLIHFPDGVTYDYQDFRLRGAHNAQNVMAAGLALYAYGIPTDHREVVKTLTAFGGVRHRTQYIGEWRGITFINDSKGTNLDATLHALEAMPDGRTILILGGTDKGNDYAEIFDLVKSKAKALIYMTTDAEKLHRSFAALPIPKVEVHGMAQAFEAIKDWDLNEGDVVLLSPACASFDLFKNYEDRGDQFIYQFERLP